MDVPVQVLDVHVLDDFTPLISLLYVASSSNQPLPSPMEYFIVGELQKGGIAQVQSTSQEQAMMRRLLYINSTRLSQDYAPQLHTHEWQFNKSFLLPLGPLSQTQIGRLANDLGCEVCSNSATQRCTSCLSVRYCSKGSHYKILIVFASSDHPPSSLSE